MIWKALTHSYMRRVHPLVRGAHTVDQLLDMPHRRVRQHAMAAVEDERSGCEVLQDVIDSAIESLAAGICLRTPVTIRAQGSIQQRSNSSDDSTPAQVSKICTASAPASNCRIK